MTLGNNTVGYTPQNSTSLEMADTIMLQPYWTDLDTTNLTDTSVYYTVYQNLQPTTNLTVKWRPFLDPTFNPTWAVEVSWNVVAPFPAEENDGVEVILNNLILNILLIGLQCLVYQLIYIIFLM